VPRGLYRLHHSSSAHFITFTCYHRYTHLSDPFVRDLFVQALERTRKLYGIKVYGFVAMPEHVHLLISEPEHGTVANAMQSLKICSAKRGKEVLQPRISQKKGNMGQPEDMGSPFWQKRYYDRNVRGKEFTEKLKYIHRNPVRRGLVIRPEDWKWSSYRHYLTGGLWRGDRVLEAQDIQLPYPIIAKRRQLSATRPCLFTTPGTIKRLAPQQSSDDPMRIKEPGSGMVYWKSAIKY
jgi:putative transposase